MNLIWDAPGALTATDIRDALSDGTDDTAGKELAATTVLTVLSRLEAKGFVQRDRDARPHLYRPTSSRVDHMARLMHDVLGSAPDREAVLARFVGQVDKSEADALRRMLDGK